MGYFFWFRNHVQSWRLWTIEEGEKGASTAEYALLLTLIVIILIGTLRTLGQALDGKLMEIINQLGGA